MQSNKCEGDRRVRAKLVEGKFGYSWLLDVAETDLIALRGKRYLPVGSTSGRVSRVLKSMGLTESHEMAPAKAMIMGRGRGLSGQAWTGIVRTGCEWGSDAVRV